KPKNLPPVALVKDLPELPRPFEREIYLFSTHIAGTTHIEGIEEIVERFTEAERFFFFREPHNQYDHLAIVVKNQNKEKLGYLPREDNPVFARLMDAGKELFGKLKSVQTRGRWQRIEIDIYLRD
ncbi:MAG: restriction endonuclease, partial [Acholeplasmataceae bacterium]|nr:restriction endonuclease [Acholeplasmataceae bacterium]